MSYMIITLSKLFDEGNIGFRISAATQSYKGLSTMSDTQQNLSNW